MDSQNRLERFWTAVRLARWAETRDGFRKMLNYCRVNFAFSPIFAWSRLHSHNYEIGSSMSMLILGWTMNNLFKKSVACDLYIMTLGLCPLLVVANTLQTGLAIGVVYLFSIMLLSLSLSTVRNLVPVELRVTAIILASATIVSLVHAFLQVWFYESSLQLGIFVPLVAMNCLLLGQTEEYALRNTVVRSCSQALVAGMGVLLIMLVLGAVREYAGLSLLQQPPGAFLLLALVIAGIQWCAARNGHVASAA